MGNCQTHFNSRMGTARAVDSFCMLYRLCRSTVSGRRVLTGVQTSVLYGPRVWAMQPPLDKQVVATTNRSRRTDQGTGAVHVESRRAALSRPCTSPATEDPRRPSSPTHRAAQLRHPRGPHLPHHPPACFLSTTALRLPIRASSLRSNGSSDGGPS